MVPGVLVNLCHPVTQTHNPISIFAILTSCELTEGTFTICRSPWIQVFLDLQDLSLQAHQVDQAGPKRTHGPFSVFFICGNGLWFFSAHRWSWEAVPFYTCWTSSSWVSSVALDQEQVSR